MPQTPRVPPTTPTEEEVCEALRVAAQAAQSLATPASKIMLSAICQAAKRFNERGRLFALDGTKSQVEDFYLDMVQPFETLIELLRAKESGRISSEDVEACMLREHGIDLGGRVSRDYRKRKLPGGGSGPVHRAACILAAGKCSSSRLLKARNAYRKSRAAIDVETRLLQDCIKLRGKEGFEEGVLAIAFALGIYVKRHLPIDSYADLPQSYATIRRVENVKPQIREIFEIHSALRFF
jgi:uncharacterized protein (DUF1778 family)